jgi:hypothetical protein
VVLKGSLEITPYFQDDINSMKPMSVRVLKALIVSVVMIAVAWILAVELAGLTQVFAVLVGALLFLEATAHIRHVRNIVFLTNLNRYKSLKGRIEYPRWLSLRLSSVEVLGFAALFLLGFLISGSWFFVGGLASCLLTGLKHLDYARKAHLKYDRAEPTEPGEAP